MDSLALPKVAKEARGRGCVNDTTIALFAKIWPCSSCRLVGSRQMNCHDNVPVLICHILDRDVTQHARVIDQDINAFVVGDCVSMILSPYSTLL